MVRVVVSASSSMFVPRGCSASKLKLCITQFGWIICAVRKISLIGEADCETLTRFSGRVSLGRSQPIMLAFLLAVFSVSCGKSHQSETNESGTNNLRTISISNTEPRRDVAGQIIDAHDGCLQFFDGRFYLYGTAYGTSSNYFQTNHHYRVYSSPDLGKWTFEGELLRGQPSGIYYRPYVVFNPKTRKYVLWYNWYPQNWGGQTGVAISTTPTGPFTIVNPNVSLSHPHAGDGSLFVDDDGTGYYIYTSIAEGYTIRVERLAPDYLSSTGEASRALAAGGESPVLFKRNNIYYALLGPRCDACPQGSETQVFTSDSPLGPFTTKPEWNINRHTESEVPKISHQGTNGLGVLTPQGIIVVQPSRDARVINATNTPAVPAQETWVAKIPTPDGEAFVWLADRWGSNPDGFVGHDFQFWAPLEFTLDGAILPVRNVARWYVMPAP